MIRPTMRESVSIRNGVLAWMLLTATPALPAFVLSTADGLWGSDTYLSNNSDSLGGGPYFTDPFGERLLLHRIDDLAISMVLLRFDLGEIPSGVSMEGATLQLTWLSPSAGSAEVAVYGMRESWADELWGDVLSFADAFHVGINPDPGGFLGDGSFSLDEYDEFTNPFGVWELQTIQSPWVAGLGSPSSMPDLDLGGFLEADTNGVATLLLVATSSFPPQRIDLASKEYGGSALAPSLVFPVPEPSLSTMLGAGVMLLWRRRRR